MRRFEIDRRGPATAQRFDPACHANAPAIARFQPWEIPLGMRSDQVVSIEHREIEKLLRKFYTHGVQTDVARSCSAISVAIKPGHRIGATTL